LREFGRCDYTTSTFFQTFFSPFLPGWMNTCLKKVLRCDFRFILCFVLKKSISSESSLDFEFAASGC